jgi:hypothetical protein
VTDYKEERDFSIVIHLSAGFDESYEGDLDGFAWFEQHFEQELKPALVRGVFELLRSHPRFVAVAAPRGRDPDRALEVELKFSADDAID